jgi:molybdopterin synthase catalytic subunit
VTVRVLLFGAAREAAGGASEAAVDLPTGATAADVIAALSSPDRGRLAEVARRSRLAVNRSFADPARPIAPADEVALIPPVGGG